MENKLELIIFKNQNKLKELQFKRMFYENFYQFNKNTGLGKTYKQTELKIKICNRLLTLTV